MRHLLNWALSALAVWIVARLVPGFHVSGPLAALIAALVIGFVVIIVTSPYRMQRILGFLDPWPDPVARGHANHTVAALGAGDPVTVRYFRGNQETNVKVVLGSS